MNKPRAVIAGGGLAGLTCAKRLADAGLAVELVEAESVFGGRATSWVDADGKDVVESGVHTFFGVYDQLSRLLAEVGVDRNKIVTWSGEIAFLDERGRYHTFGIDPVRSLPTMLAGVLGNNDLIGPSDKARITLSALRGLWEWVGDGKDTVAVVAEQAGIDEGTLNRVLRPMTRALFFSEPEELAAKAFVELFMHMAGRPLEIRAGSFNGGMGEVMIAPIVRWLKAHGVRMHNGTRISGIEYDPREKRISHMELHSGQRLYGDMFVSALPLETLQVLIPSALHHWPYFHSIRRIPTVPAVSVQLWFDRKLVGRDTFTFLPDSSVPVVQDESYVTFVQQGSRISCQITDRATDGFTDDEYLDCALYELGRFIPRLEHAVLERSAVVRHRAFHCTPEVLESHRPSQASPVPNFFVAGDFTSQSWYTTMEGAVRSGEMAANEVLAALALAAR